MKWSLFAGKISGIKIFVHWTFLILIFWIIISGARRGYNTEDILMSLIFILTVFVCVILHELGHALTAKKFHFKTRDIILLPIGGLARMEGLPDKPMHEFLVAVMGPAVNLTISFILYIFLKMTGTFPESLEEIRITQSNFWFQLYTVNIFLALFNLIPAFPMDGGRILRALLSIKLPRVRATRIAAYVGQFIAILFIVFGFLYNPILAFIGFFIFLGAQAEAAIEDTKVFLAKIKVGDLLMNNYSVINSKEPLSKAISLILESQEKAFIVKDNGEIKGTLSKIEIIEGLSKFGKEIPVEQVMRTNIVSLHKEDEVNEVVRKFSDGVDTLMPILDDGKVIGVLNLENIHEFVEIQTALRESKKQRSNN